MSTLRGSTSTTFGHSLRRVKDYSPLISIDIRAVGDCQTKVTDLFGGFVSLLDRNIANVRQCTRDFSKTPPDVITARPFIDSTPDTLCESSLGSVKLPDVKKNHPHFLEHIKSLRQNTPNYQPIPKSGSKEPLVDQFTGYVAHWLQLANTPYADREAVKTRFDDNPPGDESSPKRQEAGKHLGIFYPRHYQAHEIPGLAQDFHLRQHSLPQFFDLNYISSFVALDKGYTASECLNAFFHGPTVADCATVMLACNYRAIESIIGTDEFNRIFGAPVSKFRIPCTVFDSPENVARVYGSLTSNNLGNPLYTLFDDLGNTPLFCSGPLARGQSELAIKKGDILYIRGVESYWEKHKSGAGLGFNLVCIGKNSSGVNLYLGFGPNVFAEPKTWEQIKNILIDSYNEPQNPVTICAIKEGDTRYASLADHTVSPCHPIFGITHVLRFNLARWQHTMWQCDQAWYRQPPLTVPAMMKPKPVDHGSLFPSENFNADLAQFKPVSPEQERMQEVALKFAHAVINNIGDVLHKKPMGLFMTGLPGIGKTHLCVAVAKKVADYGVNTLYIDAVKAGTLFNDSFGDKARWNRKIDEMLAGKDLVVFDDVNDKYGSIHEFLAKAMKYVVTADIAIMVSSNQPIHIKDAIPGFIDPLTENAQNFFYLSDLQGESLRTHWWQSPEIRSADALSQLGQYQGCKAAGVIIEDAVSTDDIASKLNIPVDQIRRVGHYYLPGHHYVSPDYFLSDLSKTVHRAVFMDVGIMYEESHIIQFLNVVQKVHDEGLKLVVITINPLLLPENVQECLETNFCLQEEKPRITDRLEHMFRLFSKSSLTGTTNRS